MPTWRIRTEGAPTERRCYGGNVPTNAGSYAPPVVSNSTKFAGGCERVILGAPRRVVMGQDPQWANYTPDESQGSQWAPPVIANESFVTVTNPAQAHEADLNRPNHIGPNTPTDNGAAANRAGNRQGGKGRVPRDRVTPVPQVTPTFRYYGS